MSIKYKDENDKHEIEDKELQLELYGIKIQCPDCGRIFILNQYGEFFCRMCKRIFSEDEIRERCGL